MSQESDVIHSLRAKSLLHSIFSTLEVSNERIDQAEVKGEVKTNGNPWLNLDLNLDLNLLL
jgi:hypothetical protein